MRSSLRSGTSQGRGAQAVTSHGYGGKNCSQQLSRDLSIYANSLSFRAAITGLMHPLLLAGLIAAVLYLGCAACQGVAPMLSKSAPPDEPAGSSPDSWHWCLQPLATADPGRLVLDFFSTPYYRIHTAVILLTLLRRPWDGGEHCSLILFPLGISPPCWPHPHGTVEPDQRTTGRPGPLDLTTTYHHRGVPGALALGTTALKHNIRPG